MHTKVGRADDKHQLDLFSSLASEGKAWPGTCTLGKRRRSMPRRGWIVVRHQGLELLEVHHAIAIQVDRLYVGLTCAQMCIYGAVMVTRMGSSRQEAQVKQHCRQLGCTDEAIAVGVVHLEGMKKVIIIRVMIILMCRVLGWEILGCSTEEEGIELGELGEIQRGWLMLVNAGYC